MEQSINNLKDTIKLNRILKYLVGVVLISLGVVFSLKSDLGNSTWDTLHFALSELMHITIGWAIILVAALTIITVVILNKDFKYLLMAIPVAVVGPLVDLFNDVVFVNLEPSTLLFQLLLFILALILLPLGGALLIVSTYPAGVFDELMLALMRITKAKDLVKVRVIMEVTAVTSAYIFGVLAGIGRGKIYYGTLVFAITMGPVIKVILKLLERIGLSESKQND